MAPLLWMAKARCKCVRHLPTEILCAPRTTAVIGRHILGCAVQDVEREFGWHPPLPNELAEAVCLAVQGRFLLPIRGLDDPLIGATDGGLAVGRESAGRSDGL